MDNYDLQQAINEAFDRVRDETLSESLRMSWRIHWHALLAEQIRRATERTPKELT